MPQNGLCALGYICYNEINTDYLGSNLHWNINFPKDIDIYRAYSLQGLYSG